MKVVYEISASHWLWTKAAMPLFIAPLQCSEWVWATDWVKLVFQLMWIFIKDSIFYFSLAHNSSAYIRWTLYAISGWTLDVGELLWFRLHHSECHFCFCIRWNTFRLTLSRYDILKVANAPWLVEYYSYFSIFDANTSWSYLLHETHEQ